MSVSTFRTLRANQIDGINALRNYISNGAATDNTAGWATYADAAQSSPVSGAGGSPSVTWTRTTSSPLSLDASFLFTKDAANRQGQGASFDFTINSSDQAKVLQIQFDYAVASGTFSAGSSSADSDITVWIYDVTNAQVIQPTTYKLFASSSVSTGFISNFQTASNSTNYRLILHCSTTSASAFTLKVDNVSVSPSTYVYGSPISDWTNTLTFTPNNFGTVSNQSIWTRRVGDSLQIRGSFQAGTSVGSTASITLPYAIDSSKLSSQTNIGGVGRYARALNSSEYLNANNADGVIFFDGSDTAKIYFAGGSSGAGFVKLNANSVISSTDKVAFEAQIPIQGWASTVQMSDSADTRVVAASYYLSSNSSLTSGQKLNFDSRVTDTHGAVTTGSNAWTFTVPVSGVYYTVVNSQISTTGTGAGIYKNGVQQTAETLTANGTPVIWMDSYKAGDTIDFRAGGSMTFLGGALGGANQTTISIFRLSGPSSIAATETIAASYWVSSNFAASTSTPINFDSKEYDTHGAVTTSASAWKFTAPVSGLYLITGFIQQTTSGAASCAVYKNGSKYKPFQFSGAAASFGNSAVTQLRLNAGEYIDIRPGGGQTYFGAAAQSSDPTNIQIVRVGN